MAQPPRAFGDDTGTTPLVNLTGDRAAGPKRPCLLVVAGARLGEIFPVDGELVIGRDSDVQLRLDDEGVSRKHARVTPAGDGVLITDLGSANGVYVDGDKVNESVLKEGQKIRVGQTTIFKFARYDNVEEAAQRQLLESALRDGTTRAFNRRYFVQRLGAEVRFAERHHQKLALLIIDLDHFKEINDTRGHQTGDDVLRQIVDILAGTLRAEDVLARFGGEEFAVLARGIPEAGALHLAERLRRLVGDTQLVTGGEPVHCTISVGVSVFPFSGAVTGEGAVTDGGAVTETATDTLIERADAALYRAKQAGRNRVSQ